MTITYLPTKLLKKFSSKKNLKSLINPNLTINKAAIKTLQKSNLLSAKKIEETAIRVLKEYKKTYRKELKDGLPKAEAIDEALNNKKLIVSRMNNLVVGEIAKDIKRNYKGEYYVWLPSDAENPDPLHQLNYGKKFKIGKGEMPGDRYGCRCGMEVLVEETILDV